jgi:hypothetical protein
MAAEDEVRQASDRFHAALDSTMDGDPAPMADVWSHGSGVSTMHPLGGREHGAVAGSFSCSHWSPGCAR